MFSRIICVVAYFRTSFLLILKDISFLGYVTLFIQNSMRFLGKRLYMDKYFNFFEWIHTSEILESCSNFIFEGLPDYFPNGF